MNELRFNELLEKFVRRSSTPEEDEELRAMVRSGAYQHLFRADLMRFMEEEITGAVSDGAPGFDPDRLFESIRERRADLKPEVLETNRLGLSSWLRVAAVFLIALGLGWWLLYPSAKPAQPEMSVTDDSSGDSLIRFTRKDYIHLPDGSKVLLNDDSELTYYPDFGNTVREVHLKGDAYFDIITDKSKPFIVRSGKISTNVLGTAFYVNARDQNVVVTVERGLVQVNDENQTLSLVRPAERLTVNTENHQFEKTEFHSAAEIKWKSDRLIFDDITLKQTALLLEEHFEVKIQIDNPAIEECRISAWFLDNESLEEILEMVCGIRQARYEKHDGRIHITGGFGCND